MTDENLIWVMNAYPCQHKGQDGYFENGNGIYEVKNALTGRILHIDNPARVEILAAEGFTGVYRREGDPGFSETCVEDFWENALDAAMSRPLEKPRKIPQGTPVTS